MTTFVCGPWEPLRLLEGCHTLDVPCGESATSGDGVDEEEFPPRSIEVKWLIKDSKTGSSELARFPNVKRVFIRLNIGTLPIAPAERLFSKRCNILAKRSALSDIFERLMTTKP